MDLISTTPSNSNKYSPLESSLSASTGTSIGFSTDVSVGARERAIEKVFFVKAVFLMYL